MMIVFKPVRHLLQQDSPRWNITSLHDVGPDRAGIINIAIDLSCCQRLEKNSRSQARLAESRQSGLLQSQCQELCQHILLGECFGSNNDGSQGAGLGRARS